VGRQANVDEINHSDISLFLFDSNPLSVQFFSSILLALAILSIILFSIHVSYLMTDQQKGGYRYAAATL
jgi:hypothetical protein